MCDVVDECDNMIDQHCYLIHEVKPRPTQTAGRKIIILLIDNPCLYFLFLLYDNTTKPAQQNEKYIQLMALPPRLFSIIQLTYQSRIHALIFTEPHNKQQQRLLSYHIASLTLACIH